MPRSKQWVIGRTLEPALACVGPQYLRIAITPSKQSIKFGKGSGEFGAERRRHDRPSAKKTRTILEGYAGIFLAKRKLSIAKHV
jgi:hypothetical protein